MPCFPILGSVAACFWFTPRCFKIVCNQLVPGKFLHAINKLWYKFIIVLNIDIFICTNTYYTCNMCVSKKKEHKHYSRTRIWQMRTHFDVGEVKPAWCPSSVSDWWSVSYICKADNFDSIPHLIALYHTRATNYYILNKDYHSIAIQTSLDHPWWQGYARQGAWQVLAKQYHKVSGAGHMTAG